MKAMMDLTGQRYGRLTVLEEAEPVVYPNGRKVRRWKCLCDCGKETVVRHGGLRIGTTQSCGCLHREMFGEVNKKHGLMMDNQIILHMVCENTVRD